MEEYSVNEKISSKKIDLVLMNGEMIEGISLSEALDIAEEEGVDVVEVSKNKKSEMPICKMMDYGKLMYNRSKKRKKNQKHHHSKEIKYSLNIDYHDLRVKHDKILKFLSKDYTVRYVMELKGRQKNMVGEAKLKMTKNLEEFSSKAQWNDLQVSEGGGKVIISTTLNKI